MTSTGIPQRPGVFAGPGLTQGGLTLIELIVAIVLLGILSVGATALIVRSVQNYQTTRAAGELASQGEMALTAMARGLHNAQPGSLNLTGGTLSFTRCTAPASAAAASVCSPGYGFAFTGARLLQTVPGPRGYTAQVLAADASGGFALLPAGSTASGVFVTLALSNATADVSLTLSRVIAVLSSAYSVVNNQ